MKCPECNSRDASQDYESIFARCRDCGYVFVPGHMRKHPQNRPYGKIALVCLVLALLIPFVPVPGHWHITDCNINGCVESVFNFTRPLWVVIAGGGR